MIVHEARRAVGGKPDDRCDGQIDVAGQHHEHLPDRHDHQKRRRLSRLQSGSPGASDDAVTLVRRRLAATASLDRGGVGVHIRRCADDPFSVRLGSREGRGLRPSRKTTIRSHMPMSSGSSDEMSRIASPCEASSAIIVWTSALLWRSTPWVGSSRIMSRGPFGQHDLLLVAN